MPARVEVAAAVIINESGQYLLAQRPPGKAYAGYWEFPGGKVEPGETAGHALVRELHEELGIEVLTYHPWLTRDFDYSHAAVRLRFFRVLKWSGRMHGREQQSFAWQTIGRTSVAPMLPANAPVLRALELPSEYGITCASMLGVDSFLPRLERSLGQGLRLVQVREKAFDETTLRQFAVKVVSLAGRYGARVVINGSAWVAAESRAGGLHLTSSRLMAATRRPDVAWCGASCHNAAELERARELGLDFVVLGPVMPTPSHPDAAPLGWQAFSGLVRDYPLPVYALGGMHRRELERAWSCGAHGVAMVRGAWGL